MVSPAEDAGSDHSIAVKLHSPDGVEPAEYVSEPLGRRPCRK